MALRDHKTKIVATIGPASDSQEMLERLISAGMDVARLNFSHGDFTAHGTTISRLRAAEKAVGRPVTIMADLPGPKMRLGTIAPEPILLKANDRFTLTSEQITGNAQRVSMTFEALPRVVRPGNRLFLNDGLVQLVVERVVGNDVECVVVVGGGAPLPKGAEPPRDRPGHPSLHAPRPRLPELRPGARRGRRQPVVRRAGSGSPRGA
ncbi:MAG: pyruvate kinase [Myxococcales bacterium]